MLKNGVRHLPVTEGNRKDIIGINTTTDFAKYLERRLESSDSQSSLLLQALCTEEEPTEERDIP
jgi:CBS domain containing-hemolysin-like protein